MNSLILATSVTEYFAAGSGVAAAVLIIGGILALRWQRNRYEYDLMKQALSQGITHIPASQPAWLASFRQGLMTLTLGIGLAAVGAAGWVTASRVQAPPATTQPIFVLESGGADTDFRRDKDKGKDKDSDSRRTKLQRPFNPAKDRWERAQDQQQVSQAATGIGLILILLGGVRMTFARAEQKYAAESEN